MAQVVLREEVGIVLKFYIVLVYNYFSLFYSNLNGMYLGGRLPKSQRGKGISWHSFRGSDYSLKFVQMMIREKQN